MKTEQKLITPEWAQSRLNELEKAITNGTFKQRTPRPRAIQRYASDMLAGKWLLTHQGLAFDVNGNLLDGQNRLWAVVQSGVSVKMMVTTEIAGNGKLSAMDVIDGGMSRCLATHLQLSHGYGPEANEASSLVKAVVRLVFETNYGVNQKAKAGYQISAQQALFVLDDLGLRNGLERFRAVIEKKRFRNRALCGAWCWYFADSPVKAETFLHQYSSLENLTAKAPALLLSKYFSSVTKKMRKNDPELLRVVSNAISAYDQDTKLTDLRASKEALNWLVNLQPKMAKAIVHRITGAK